MDEHDLEDKLAYHPPLREPLGFVNAVLRSLPAALPLVSARPSLRSRLLVAAIALGGLLLMLLPDTFLLGTIAGWLADVGGTVSSAGESLNTFVNNPAVNSNDFARDLFSHPSVLLGLCLLTLALFLMLYQALSTPLPNAHNGGKVAAR